MNDTLKIHLISAANTFLASFLTVLGTALATAGTLEFSTAFWGGLIIAAIRAGVKSVINSFVPVRLGGRK